MRTYTPNSWCVIKEVSINGETGFRVGGGWMGGYTQGRSWKINSGITEYTKRKDDKGRDLIDFSGVSGSVYTCYVDSEGADWYLKSVIDGYAKDLGEENFKVIKFEEFEQLFNKEK